MREGVKTPSANEEGDVMKYKVIKGSEEMAEIEEYLVNQVPIEKRCPEILSALDKDLRVIRDMSELDHTCYIEVCPENKKKKSCWNKGALYFSDTGFEYLEPMIKDAYPDYCQYSFQELTQDEWCGIIMRFKGFLNNLQGAECGLDIEGYVSRLPFYSKESFDVAFAYTRDKLISFLNDVIGSLETELKENRIIHILGL